MKLGLKKHLFARAGLTSAAGFSFDVLTSKTPTAGIKNTNCFSNLFYQIYKSEISLNWKNMLASEIGNENKHSNFFKLGTSKHINKSI